MNIAFIGCGHVFDYYMDTKWAHTEFNIIGVFDINTKRAKTVGEVFGLKVYDSQDDLLSDPSIQLVVNLTNIDAHYEVTKSALNAGKHVYSEKPLTTDVEKTRELFNLAKEKNLTFSGAPCNVYSDSVCTMWKAVLDGAIGMPVLIYAELDDSPVHLSSTHDAKGPTGAPWPYVEEFQQGCTFEHAGYHLIWICAMFGPATSVTAFSKALIKHKTDTPLSPADTPDYSVGCLNFENGVTARITNSIVAPRDHRLRIIGEEGEICADRYCSYQSPVWLERFSSVSLNARKASTLRNQPWLGRLFGAGGVKVPLVRRWKSEAVQRGNDGKRTLKQKAINWLRRRETHNQDKLLGIAEMVKSLKEGYPQILTPELLTHVNELTLIIQRAGPDGITTKPSTTFTPIKPPEDVANYPRNYLTEYKSRWLEKLLSSTAESLHKG
jgi:predicted dehydrogenase